MSRPLRFADVVGQQVAIKLIMNALKMQKLPRAVILHGPSGTGKTTIARLIAAWFVCENKSEDICGQCKMCLAVQNGAIPDIIELDAASNTGVDDVRQILDQTNYAPQFSSERIFIIDEAHMLSKNAISAFLKAFEETMSHVRFVLATTEIEKIPEAIRSRCLCIGIRSLTNTELRSAIVAMLSNRQINFENEAVEIIAEVSGGSLREVYSIIEQVLLLQKDEMNLTLQSVYEVLAFVSDAEIIKLFDYVKSGQAIESYEFVTQLLERNVSPISILQQLICYARKLYAISIENEIKQKILKIMIHLNKLQQDYGKIGGFIDLLSVGIAEIAFRNE